MDDLQTSQQPLRVVGVFPSAAALQQVMDALEQKGFDHSQFGVLTTGAGAHPTSADAVAAAPSTSTDPPDDPDSTATIATAVITGLTYVGAMTALGAMVMTGGGLGVALLAAGAAGGAGGLTGLLVMAGFSHQHAEHIDAQISSGGVVLWIQPRDAGQQALAQAAVQAAGAIDTGLPGA